MSKVTDYELGNWVHHNCGDDCSEIADDCRESHPELSKFFFGLARAFHWFGQDMEEMSKDGKNRVLISKKFKKRIEKSCSDFNANNVQGIEKEGV